MNKSIESLFIMTLVIVSTMLSFTYVATAFDNDINEAVDNYDLYFYTEPEGSWFYQTDITHDGLDAAKSVTDGGVLKTYLHEFGSLKFWCKAGSSNGDCSLWILVRNMDTNFKVYEDTLDSHLDWEYYDIDISQGTNNGDLVPSNGFIVFWQLLWGNPNVEDPFALLDQVEWNPASQEYSITFSVIPEEAVASGAKILFDNVEYSDGQIKDDVSLGTHNIDVILPSDHEFNFWSLDDQNNLELLQDCHQRDNQISVSGDGVLTAIFSYNLQKPPNIPETPFGTTQGIVGETYEYSTFSEDDNDDDIRYGWDWNGDGDVEDWTEYYTSGTTAYGSHLWGVAGTYNVQVIAEDEHGAQSDLFSTPLTVIIEVSPNNPPSTPTALSCSVLSANEGIGIKGTEYVFETYSSDPDGDMIKYLIDFDGNGVDHTTDLFVSGVNAQIPITFNNAGTYYLTAKAEDEHGTQSDSFSNPPLVIQIRENSAPLKPEKPDGTQNGNIKNSYTYSASTIDPNGDSIYYMFDWGDGTDSGWIGPEDSGDEIMVEHSWNKKGNYYVHVKAKDKYGAQSEWSDPLSISMPRSRAVNTPLFNFLEQHPILSQLIQRFLNL